MIRGSSWSMSSKPIPWKIQVKGESCNAQPLRAAGIATLSPARPCGFDLEGDNTCAPSVTIPFSHTFFELSEITTDKETTLPTISGLFGTRGGGRRFSLNRVEKSRRLTPSQETVLLRFLGHGLFPTFSRRSLLPTIRLRSSLVRDIFHAYLTGTHQLSSAGPRLDSQRYYRPQNDSYTPAARTRPSSLPHVTITISPPLWVVF